VTGARRGAVLLLLALGGSLASVLLLAHHGEGPAISAVEAVCGEKDSGCDQTNRGPYSTFAGVPVAAYGVVFYLVLLLATALGVFAPEGVARGAGALAFCGLALGLVVDLVLLGVQAFAIHHFCSLCLTTYALSAGALVALLPVAKPSLLSELGSKEARLFTASLAMGGLAILGGVSSLEWALQAREAGRTSRILGAPTAGADGEAQRLQAILDDPVKLDQYLNQKASRDFDNAQPQTLSLTGVPFRGPDAAPIKVVVFSDFLCPFCRQAAQGFANWLPQSAGRVAIYYKNYPLENTCNDRVTQTIHPGACVVALGGVCAQEQGKFWLYHDKIFGVPPLQNPQAADVLRLGTEAGLDGGALSSCLTSEGAKKRLTAEIHEGSDAGVSSTPTVYIDGRKLPRIDHFLESIEKESKRLNLPPLPRPSP
jgi:protein-disulfide isomerase/uncharacterized membrane protein